MGMRFHFENVGHGECTLIELPDDNLMIVDMNCDADITDKNAAAIAHELGLTLLEGSNNLAQLSEAYTIELDDVLGDIADILEDGGSIVRYVQTHPDLDHMRGLAPLLDTYAVRNFWDTDHQRIEKTSFLSASDERDWNAYKERRLDRKCFERGSQVSVGGYTIHVFHPTADVLAAGDSDSAPRPNALSQVLLVQYGETRVLLTGDMEQDGWEDLYEWVMANPSAKALLSNIDVLQAAHHGRDSGRCGWQDGGTFRRDFLNLLNPDLVVVSVGQKPSTDKTPWYRARPDGTSREVWSTRWRGTIWVEADEVGSPKFDSRHRSDDAQEGRTTLATLGVSAYGLAKVRIIAKASATKGGVCTIPYDYWEKKPLRKDKQVEFAIKTEIPEPFDLYWRVTNTGPEATDSDDLRGDLIPDKNRTRRLEEHTKYKGVHFVEAFIVKDGRRMAKCKMPVRIK